MQNNCLAYESCQAGYQTDPMQISLFSDNAPHRQTFSLDQGQLDLLTGIFSPGEAEHLFLRLQESLQWSQAQIRIQGRVLPIPRLQAWYGDPGTGYGYSGIRLEPLPWTPELQQIRERLAELCRIDFNSVLCNLYRNGQDSVSWHADNEAELGINPVIASVSLGATRRFQLKPRRGAGDTLNLDLPHNSLLIMGGVLQHHWIHQVPKTRQPVGPRINLTFRRIHTG